LAEAVREGGNGERGRTMAKENQKGVRREREKRFRALVTGKASESWDN
jgi:hypothetical protein